MPGICHQCTGIQPFGIETGVPVHALFCSNGYNGRNQRQQSGDHSRISCRLQNELHSKAVDYRYHGSDLSYLEAVLARGDRRLAPVLEYAMKLGAGHMATGHFVKKDVRDGRTVLLKGDDPGKDHLIERIESRGGIRTVEAAAALGLGSREYELITV